MVFRAFSEAQAAALVVRVLDLAMKSLHVLHWHGKELPTSAKIPDFRTLLRPFYKLSLNQVFNYLYLPSRL